MLESDGFFLLYVGALALSAVLLLTLAITGLGKPTTGARVLNGILGLAAGAYAFYLITSVFINGGEYRIFFYAFILPIFSIFQIVKGFKERGEAEAAAANPYIATPPAQPNPYPMAPPAPQVPAQPQAQQPVSPVQEQ